MDIELMAAIGKAGGVAALGMAAIGSSLGAGTAGMAAIGAWKKCYAMSKAAPYTLLIFIGAPLSQTIYGMILMSNIAQACEKAVAAGDTSLPWPAMLSMGLIGGAGMGASAWFQGKAGAAGSDALGETGQGFSNYLMTLGIVETVALFVLVFCLIYL